MIVSMDLVYLDNNATTRPTDAVAGAVAEVHTELWGNPSSVHRFGQRVRQRLELARQQVAALIGAHPAELVFTSGGTESIHLALHGLLSGVSGRVTLVTNRVEHSAVRELAEGLAKSGVDVVWLPVDGDGAVHPEAVRGALAGLSGRVVLSVQWANNETGTIQPVDQIAVEVESARSAAREAGTALELYFHVDATQAAGKLPVDVSGLGVDLLTLAAHKFHGPKGVGALWVRRGVRLRPVQRGGAQERERRGGTENTAGIVGMGVAAEQAAACLVDAAAVDRVRVLRDRLEAGVVEALPDAVVNSGGAAYGRLWNTTNLGFPRVEAEAVLLGLSERGVCASAGAACSSGSLEPSPVLLAMGVPEAVAHGSVRFSLSRFTSAAEVGAALEHVPAVVGRLRRTLPMGG